MCTPKIDNDLSEKGHDGLSERERQDQEYEREAAMMRLLWNAKAPIVGRDKGKR